MSQVAGKTVDQTSYVLASVVRLPGGNGALMTTSAVGNSISDAVALRYKYVNGDSVKDNNVVITIPDNVGGGILRFINEDGSSPSGVMKLTGMEGNTPCFTLKPAETFTIAPNATEIRLMTTAAGHYQIAYLVKA